MEFISLDNSIWHSLKSTNSWLFYTKSDSCTITCQKAEKSLKTEIFGVGRITIHPNCEIHTENSILLPTHSTNTNIDLDLILRNLNHNVFSSLTETLKSVIPRNLTNIKVIQDFIDLARKASNVHEFQLKNVEPLFIFKAELNIVILYSMSCIILITIGILIVVSKNKKIKMYKPEITDIPKNDIEENL